MNRTRQYFVFTTLVLSLLALFFRLFYLQVIKYELYKAKAEGQHNTVRKISPARGTIFDRFMEPLAVNIDKTSVCADPRSIKNKTKTAWMLSEILGVDESAIMRRLSKDKAFVWIKRRISDKKADEVKDAGISGVFFVDENTRIYPNEGIAAQVIGYAGIDNTGLEGVELFYNDKLTGKPGRRRYIRDARRKPVLAEQSDSMIPQHGYSIVLNIDSVIQYIVEEEISKTARDFNARSVTAVVMEPLTGKVLAMASYPGYNLNNAGSASSEVKKNLSVVNIFEPGSVFKIVTACAAINEGIVDADDTFYCENGKYRVGGRILSDYHAYGDLTFPKVISKSSNIGTVKIAQKLGAKKLYEYICKFGFGRKTGIDIPGEAAGINRPPSIWSRSDITTIPIGQGIAVTPLQMVSAISCIANNGILMKPYIVDKMITIDGEDVYLNKPVRLGKVLDDETCIFMKDILEDVVVNGTGRKAASKKYSFCGKTGTAQKVSPEGGYYPDKYYATFIGFGPKENPKISMIVTADDPNPVHFGGSVAAPAFKNIAERVLQYLESNETERIVFERERV